MLSFSLHAHSVQSLLHRLGNKAFGEKQYDEAIKLYSDAIKLDPSQHVFFSNRRYVKLGRLLPLFSFGLFFFFNNKKIDV
jgi:tetratricopeptide (TPR) repeat protein